MQFKVLGLGAAVPLAAVTLMSMSAPAQAQLTLGNGDTLNITGSVEISETQPFFLDFGSSEEENFGNFGVTNPTTTGGFTQYETNGAITPGYRIFDVDFAAFPLAPSSLATPFTFLSVDKGVDSFDFVITKLISRSFLDFNPLGLTTAVFDGEFRNGGTTFAKAVFTANFNQNNDNGSFSGTFVVEKTEVPEPGAIGGLLVIGSFGIGLMLKRQRLNSATLALSSSFNDANDLN